MSNKTQAFCDTLSSDLNQKCNLSPQKKKTNSIVFLIIFENYNNISQIRSYFMINKTYKKNVKELLVSVLDRNFKFISNIMSNINKYIKTTTYIKKA